MINPFSKRGWKTLTGAAVTALAFLSSPEVLHILPAEAAKVIGTLGALLTAYGIHHAQKDKAPALKAVK